VGEAERGVALKVGFREWNDGIIWADGLIVIGAEGWEEDVGDLLYKQLVAFGSDGQ